MLKFKKGNVTLKEMKKELSEYGNLSGISFKGWQEVSLTEQANGIVLWIDNTSYSLIHGTFGFPTVH